jgi:hypothetical protein
MLFLNEITPDSINLPGSTFYLIPVVSPAESQTARRNQDKY